MSMDANQNTAVEIIAPGVDAAALTLPQRMEAISETIHAIEKLQRDHMDKGVDYGEIPGCDKPTLHKPGSEKLHLLFCLSYGDPIVEDLGNNEEDYDRIVHYRIKIPIINRQTGVVIGYGLGEASTDEEKYHWRKAAPPEEYEDTPDEHRRLKWRWGKRQGNKPPKNYQQPQVRILPASVANTILKMAKKRAGIDATLNVTAASSVFMQDIEDEQDRDALGYEPNAKPPQPPAEPKPKSSSKSGGDCATVKQMKMLRVRLDQSGIAEGLIKAYIESLGITSGKIDEKVEGGAEHEYVLRKGQVNTVLEWIDKTKPKEGDDAGTREPGEEG